MDDKFNSWIEDLQKVIDNGRNQGFYVYRIQNTGSREVVLVAETVQPSYRGNDLVCLVFNRKE